MVSWLTANWGSLVVPFLSALLGLIVGIHPAWDNSQLVQIVSKLLGGNPPAPPAA